MVNQTASLRQKHTDRTRTALMAAAFQLFKQRGYAATTIDEIAAHADVAPRTFFRYFRTKEALLSEYVEGKLAVALDLIDQRPIDEAPQESLMAALLGAAEDMASDQERLILIQSVAKDQPSLMAYQQQVILDNFGAQAAARLARRAGQSEPDLKIKVIATVVLGCLCAAMSDWISTKSSESFRPFLEEAFASAYEAFDRPNHSG